jgi:hypothetical protein
LLGIPRVFNWAAFANLDQLEDFDEKKVLVLCSFSTKACIASWRNVAQVAPTIMGLLENNQLGLRIAKTESPVLVVSPCRAL